MKIFHIHFFTGHHFLNYLFSSFILLSLTSCQSATSETSEKIAQHFQSSGRTFVHLAEVVDFDWDRVCILGPYSDNKAAQQTLGLEWDAEANTSISSNDTIALLVFLKGNMVAEAVEHPRHDGDFTNLSRKCYLREKAMFSHQANPGKGWPGLFPKK